MNPQPTEFEKLHQAITDLRTEVLDTIRAINHPTDTKNGLTVVYNAGGTYTNKTLKAVPWASLPLNALAAYFDGP